MWPFTKQTPPTFRSKNAKSQRGASLGELAIVFAIGGVLAGPIIGAATSSQDTLRTEQSRIVLEQARDALIAYAASNSGCLPNSADLEGGLPDPADTGASANNKHAGDLPWVDLKLAGPLTDGDGLVVQYYVAKDYTCKNVDEEGDCLDTAATGKKACKGEFKGFQWNPAISYDGTLAEPRWVFYTPPGGTREMYKVQGPLPAGTPPNSGLKYFPPGSGKEKDVSKRKGKALPNPLLEIRRGPDVLAAGSQSDVLSAQNVFVLIAPGTNNNAYIKVGKDDFQERTHIRDTNHMRDGNDWKLDESKDVNKVTFSATHNGGGTDQGNDGDDVLLAMSFLEYRVRLREFGLNMEPIKD